MSWGDGFEVEWNRRVRVVRRVVVAVLAFTAWAVSLLLVAQGWACAQTIYATQFNPGDGNAVPGNNFVVTSYADIGPGGSYQGYVFAGYVPVSGACGSTAIVYPAKVIYRYYGQVSMEVCSYNGSAFVLATLPTVSVCLDGYTLQAGLCVVAGSGPVSPTEVECISGDSETACLTRRVNALIQQISPAEPYDAIAGFGFFSLTMGGVLFIYFFSTGIGLLLEGVKKW